MQIGQGLLWFCMTSAYQPSPKWSKSQAMTEDGSYFGTNITQDSPPTFLEVLFLFCVTLVLGFAPLGTLALLGNSQLHTALGLPVQGTRALLAWGFPVAIVASSLLQFCAVYRVSIHGVKKGWTRFGLTVPSIEGLAVTALFVAILLGAQSLILYLMPAAWIPPAGDQFRAYMPAFGSGSWTIFAIAAVFTAPIAEESIFRGVLFPWCKQLMGFWGAAFASSALFSALHFYFLAPGGVIGLVLSGTIFSAGLGFCWLFERYKCLTLCVAGHALFNGILLLLN